MKNNKLAALFISTALVIPGIIASTSNPANAESIEQQTQEVDTPNEIDNSSANSAAKKPTIESYIDTPIGKAEVNVTLPLNEANCLIQKSGLNPLNALPILTPRLGCAGNNYQEQP